MDELKIRQIVKEELSILVKSDRFVFERLIQILDGRNIQLGTGTGTKIGTAVGQKISVYGKTPVMQAGAITAAATQSDSYVQADVQSIASAVNSIRTALTNF